MAHLTLREVEELLNAKTVGKPYSIHFTGVSIDSRSIKKGNIFIAIVGKKHDAHRFIPDAFKNGATLAITSKETPYPHIRVPDTFSALKRLAGYTLRKSGAFPIAVLGSSGKTSTKDLLFEILKSYNAHKTYGNENNFIGVSKTLLALENHRLCVVEVGTNHPGEIADIASFFQPKLAIFTNIGTSHIGNFGSIDAIAREKVSIVAPFTDVVYNYDDHILRKHFYPEKIGCSMINPTADTYIRNITTNFITVQAGARLFNLPINKAIHPYSLLLAVRAAVAYDPDIDSSIIAHAVESFRAPLYRMQEETLNNTVFILDCYNANPDSMRYALSTLARREGKKLAILGDMLELGEFTDKYHKQLGEFVRELNLDLITYGKHSIRVAEASTKNARHFENKRELAEYLKQIYTSFDVVLIKGSRAMKMEEIFYALKGE